MYIGVLRHALALPPGTDALAELEARLLPPDRAQRPPMRAPGIARLAIALKAMRRGVSPADSIEQFREDLRFLRMFDNDTSWSTEALDKLMAKVVALPVPPDAPPSKQTQPTEPDASNVVPLRRKPPPPGDA